MSKVRICDRCGEKLARRCGIKIDIHAFKYSYFSLDSIGEYTYDQHDLCPDCMKDYHAFMKGAVIVREEENT